MTTEICELKVLCPHCGARNEVTYLAEIETYRIDCSHCRRAIGFNPDLASGERPSIVLQGQKVA